jgi:hypothetical protein
VLSLDDFRKDLLNQASTRASVEGIFTEVAFVAEASDLLRSADEMDSIDLMAFTGPGRRRQSLAVNGFHFDENDMSVNLVVGHYIGGDSETPTLTQTEAATSLKSLEQFLREAITGDFLTDREPSTLEYQLAERIRLLHGGIGVNAINRYRLYLVTDAKLSVRAKSIDSSAVNDTRIEFHIWDIQRFYQVHQSSSGRESLELDLTASSDGGIPALKVVDNSGDITTFLAALPGDLLAMLYRDHGSRLLEGNVRSFLTIRGKINRGIRETILREPAHFLAYNNGISATASSVEYFEGRITKVVDLQIVNGGQTTASLFYANQSNRDLDLSAIFVQMKLVVVSPEDAREMVPLVSRYANSQNAVREDDFFSNSAFHIRMEDLSKSVLAPAKAGINFQTKWYYERTRGQYLNERNRRTTAAQRTFDAEFPRLQVITKTEAAKYVVAWECQPHLVSAGAQKNFMAFAKIVASSFANQPQAFNEDYFKRMVAKAILFNSVRSAIAKAPWYEAGYLANITAYAVAKLSHAISSEKRAQSFDLLRIWQQQAVGEATLTEAVAIAQIALRVLTDPSRAVVNVTEWAKRESAWKQLANEPYKLSDEFLRECLPIRLNALGQPAVTVGVRFPVTETEREHIRSIPTSTWTAIRQFFAARSSLSAPDGRLLNQVTTDSDRMLDIEDARDLLRVYVRALNEGWTEILAED